MVEKKVSLNVMEVNKALFYKIVYDTTLDTHLRYNIGTYKEKKLHVMMKRYFEENAEYHEVPINGYIADVCRDGVITEIQTGGFSGLKPKLAAYLNDYKVRLVYPLAYAKYVSWIDPTDGSITSRKRSPKKETMYTALFEMVRILPYVKNDNLTVVVPFLEVDEYRLLDGWSRDRKRGSHRYERIPTELFKIEEIYTDADYARYIPDSCETNFTRADFAKATHISLRDAGGILNVYIERGLIVQTGKRGNAHLYSRVI